MLSSPRRPAITIRTFSSAEYWRRVARRMSRTAFSASSECVSAFDLISAPSTVKMSRNLSLPQLLKTVQLVLTGNSGDVWRLKGGQSREHHLAVMQDELASLCILAGSRPAHVV